MKAIAESLKNHVDTSLVASENEFSLSKKQRLGYLEAFAVDNGRTAVIVLSLGDPHRLERSEGRRIDPPIHTEYLRSGGATIITVIVGGASAVISFWRRSAIPSNMVEPPEHTTFAYKSFLISTSQAMMVLNVVVWIPSASFPTIEGWKSASGHLNRAT